MKIEEKGFSQARTGLPPTKEHQIRKVCPQEEEKKIYIPFLPFFSFCRFTFPHCVMVVFSLPLLLPLPLPLPLPLRLFPFLILRNFSSTFLILFFTTSCYL